MMYFIIGPALMFILIFSLALTILVVNLLDQYRTRKIRMYLINNPFKVDPSEVQAKNEVDKIAPGIEEAGWHNVSRME